MNAILHPTIRLPYRLTVEQYLRLGETGILTPEDRTELLDGFLASKMTQNPPHSFAISSLYEFLVLHLPKKWTTHAQLPIILDESVPEPDLSVMNKSRRTFDDRHPVSDDLLLLIEVSDTTLEQDRNFKGKLYAEAGIPVYWIVNLIEEKVEVYTSPKRAKKSRYLDLNEFTKTQRVPLILEGKEIAHIAVKDILPKQKRKSS